MSGGHCTHPTGGACHSSQTQKKTTGKELGLGCVILSSGDIRGFFGLNRDI